MTLDELIQKYREQLHNTSDKTTELKKIIQEINNLTYSESKQPISQQDKLKILEGLRIKIVSESLTHFAQENSEFLDLLDATIKRLGGK